MSKYIYYNIKIMQFLYVIMFIQRIIYKLFLVQVCKLDFILYIFLEENFHNLRKRIL